jgi:hypothetical protein
MVAHKVKWMRMVYNYFKKTYLLFLACIWILTLSHGITANPQHSATVNTPYTFIPVGVETVVFRLDVTNLTTTANMTLDTIQLDKIGSNFNFNSIDKISVYRDNNEDFVFNPEIDIKVIENTSISNDTAALGLVPGGTSRQISTDSSVTFWIVFQLSSLESQLTLGDTSQIQITSIRVCDEVPSCTKNTLNSATTITSVGLKMNLFPDKAPSYIFPGSLEIPLAFFTLEAKGDSLTNFVMKISDSYGNFVGSDGVKGVKLKQDSDLTGTAYSSSLTTTNVTITQETNNAWSETSVTLNNWTLLDPLAKDSQKGIWLVYDFGEDIVVSSDSRLNVTIMGDSDFYAQTSQSNQIIVTPNINLSIPFAGIEITDITNIAGDEVYDKNTSIPLLSFKLRAHQAPVTVNKITVINNGSIPFYATAGTTINVKKILIYNDTDNTNTLSPQLDSVVGQLTLGPGSNQNTSAEVPMEVPITAYNGNDSNISTFFVVYELGTRLESNSATKNYVTAEIGDIIATGNNGISNISFKASVASNSNPISSTPVTSVDLTETNLQIVSTEALSSGSDTAYDGQLKVPMLYLNFKSETLSQSGKLTILNNQANFFSRADGVTKVWVYLDDNKNKVLDDGDKFLRSTSKFDDLGIAELENIEFSFDNHFLILYDIGLLASETGVPFSAQIQNIEIEGGTSSVSGVLPTVEVAKVTPIDNLLKTLTIEDVSQGSVTFNIRLKMKNESGVNLTINQFEPKFYLSEKGGMDISYEFNTSLATAEVIPFTINNGETKDFNFNASHYIPYSQGVTVIDAYVEYSKEGESDNLRFIRYQSGSGDWNLITSQQEVYERNIISNMTSADIPPSYLLHPLKVCDNKSNNSCKDFLNGSSIGKDKIMSLEFVDVSTIDESTINLMRGNNFLFQKEEISVDSNNFMLDQSTNLLKFYVGDEDATISLSLKDLSGNDMPMTALNYLISEETEVTHPLFYPNPYVLGNDNLKFNYSVSKDNTKVSMYIYNHLGLLVYQSSEIVNSGSNTMSLSETEEFMVPGIFICRLIAEVDGKVVSSKTTRLAIY